MNDKAAATLDDIRIEFLKYAPAYAQREAAEAIDKIADLQTQGLIRNGLYYIVLVDLVGSTKFASEHGNDKAGQRIKHFVSTSFHALNEVRVKNVGLFVKEIGDAVLFIFQHFPDIVRWRAAHARWLSLFDKSHPIEVRTCVHLGEVYLEGVNPLSLGVSQCFKMEKKVGAGDVVLTDLAYHAAWSTLARAYHAFVDYGEVELDGYPSPVRLHKLSASDASELDSLAKEELE